MQKFTHIHHHDQFICVHMYVNSSLIRNNIKAKNGKAVFIAGYLNTKSLVYNFNESVKNVFNLVFENNFMPFIQRPTRVKKNYSYLN